MIAMIGLRNIPSSIAKDAGELDSVCRAAPRKLSIPPGGLGHQKIAAAPYEADPDS
jgi:hypothetical protein